MGFHTRWPALVFNSPFGLWCTLRVSMCTSAGATSICCWRLCRQCWQALALALGALPWAAAWPGVPCCKWYCNYNTAEHCSLIVGNRSYSKALDLSSEQHAWPKLGSRSIRPLLLHFTSLLPHCYLIIMYYYICYYIIITCNYSNNAYIYIITSVLVWFLHG